MIVKGEFFVAEKENASRLRAADFARICGTNKRTLHHYDQIGLFAPALRGENGYRYYSQEQYDVFMVIAALKELGMPLLDIKAYLDRFRGWSDLEFCEWMIREIGVAAVPGSSFFREPVNHLIRLHFARSEETLEHALDRLAKLAALLH